ncbi:spore coat protein U domain-containing protein [Sulfurisoma sediminicola]|uniref:Spore coat protein U-like protein n=1 Tax=Sulfurisoma sediminicola TaxID=1381557 RepID=A0A497XBF8_9PROT|nr:spore coat protein U domain-containing protein [Sulfurisoma sediminicola]RLJ63713.1 spore coat protein U-like protein [Sulfurisoma sediminicola]
MKFSKLILVGALGAAGVLGNGVALAADTAAITVSAAVLGTCKFVAPKTGALAFGNLDPSVGGNVNGTATNPSFWCTKGASYTISDDFGVNEAVAGVAPRRMKHATLAEYIPYTFTYTATGTGAGPGTPATLNLAGQVLGTDYANVSAGNYGDTVTLSITP